MSGATANTIERRPEIGLRRALGAKRSQSTRQIVLEATTTGALAGITGTAIAMIIIVVVVGGTAAVRQWNATLDPAVIASAPIIGLATGALADALPAARASRTPPAVTLRS